MPTAAEFENAGKQYKLGLVIFNKVQKSFMDTV